MDVPIPHLLVVPAGNRLAWLRGEGFQIPGVASPFDL